ncbi:MAG: hypothetical protein WC347_04655 [Smithellaceae bacterium]|jgi:hypothetical protein
MTLYVIERKAGEEWKPLSMFPVVANTMLGIQYDAVSCVRSDYDECAVVLDVLKKTFRGEFRISEYEREEKQKCS